MTSIILFDNLSREALFPFSATRAVADIWCGAMTNRTRWEQLLKQKCYSLSTPLINNLHSPLLEGSSYLYVNAHILANEHIKNAITELSIDNKLVADNGEIIAFHSCHKIDILNNLHYAIDNCLAANFYKESFLNLAHAWDIFSLNGAAIEADFPYLKYNTKAMDIPAYVQIVGDISNVIIEEGAEVLPCIINAQTGPVFIAKDATIMEGCLIRGPFVLQSQGVLKMGAKVYGPTTIGNGSKAGGELNNVVFFENSNKGHDGFLGNAVIGAWCNLGADTNCSNLKNNYDMVKIWDVTQGKLVSTGLQFCGLLMGDHSKCGINTMFNTGTVIGVSANIFGTPFPPKFIPSFTWGGVNESEKYRMDKAFETANRMMERRNIHLDEAEKLLLADIYNEPRY